MKLLKIWGRLFLGLLQKNEDSGIFDLLFKRRLSIVSDPFFTMIR